VAVTMEGVSEATTGSSLRSPFVQEREINAANNKGKIMAAFIQPFKLHGRENVARVFVKKMFLIKWLS
jgi:hypothetical protein